MNFVATLFLFFSLLVTTTRTLAQTSPPFVFGKALDAQSGKGVDNASVQNQRTKQITRTNHLGAFFLKVKPGDSLIVVSITHGRAGIQWDGLSKEPVVPMTRQLPDEAAIELPGVTVRGKREAEIRRELQQILSEPEARKNLSADEIIDLAESPITMLYELFSRQAKSQRKARVLDQQFRRHRLADFRLELLIGQATNLRGNAAERFKTYCHFSDEFLLTSSEYDITFEILQKLEDFQKL